MAVAALCEEAGRAAFPSPLLATFNVSYLLAAAASPAADSALEAIAAGAAATYAGIDARGSWEYADTDISVNDGKLSGKVDDVVFLHLRFGQHPRTLSFSGRGQ